MTYDGLAAVVVALGLVAGLAAALVGGYRSALAVALDLWLAAGLLRLAATPSWPRLAAAAAVVVVRRLARSGLVHPPPFGPLRLRVSRPGSAARRSS